MRTPHLFAGLVALTTPLLVGCAGADHSAEAGQLRTDLAALPGVADVDLDYTEPIVLDSAKVKIRVEMEEGAASGDLTQVVARAFEAFSSTHDGEEGDLDVVIGDDVVHLRSFQPDADVGAVGDAVDRALTVLPVGPVRVDVNTQDVDRWPHVESTFTVTLPTSSAASGAESGSDSAAARVLETLTALERDHGDVEMAHWRVETAGPRAWGLGSTEGFPGTEAHALFADLGDTAAPGAGVKVIDDFVEVEVPRGTRPKVASAMVESHLGLLGGVRKAFYDVNGRRSFHVMIAAGDCYFADDAVGARLRDDLAETCTTVYDDSEDQFG